MRNERNGRGRGGHRRPDRAGRDKVYVYGRHALAEALSHAPHAVRKVFLSPAVDDEQLLALVEKRGVTVEMMKGREADRMVGDETAHQGVIAVVDPGALVTDFRTFFEGLQAKAVSENTMLVLLDELTDPHNVGAIIRSAAAFGAAGVLMPSHNQAPITGAVVKASAGMAFRVPLVQIGNVNYTVDLLKKEAFRTYGLAMDGERSVADEPFDAPALFIVGNEGAGIREKTFERCDVGLRIPMHERTESLNASVSAAVVLYAWSLKHPSAIQ
ncbi:MAG TPA: 23S rRNA (guanosine(2251)-2'-O)-methyltransferase RlmB [Candidatus Paceibacterota bacterium]|nr:23S rRNA (guanosine(2251)-2'-O)-methyltransferase RlmB [Candidatus Paceibacterota bacterium]